MDPPTTVNTTTSHQRNITGPLGEGKSPFAKGELGYADMGGPYKISVNRLKDATSPLQFSTLA